MSSASVPTVGIAWATFFRSRGGSWIMRLPYAYRAPMLFAAGFARAGGAQASCFAADESLEAGHLDGSAASGAHFYDVAYLAAHGRLRNGEFELVMHHDDWRPAVSGLDGPGPLVAVFDACDLTDLAAGWEGPWEARLRPRLRLLLGFASLATVGKAEALRGAEFAERMARGEPGPPRGSLLSASTRPTVVTARSRSRSAWTAPRRSRSSTTRRSPTWRRCRR